MSGRGNGGLSGRGRKFSGFHSYFRCNKRRHSRSNHDDLKKAGAAKTVMLTGDRKETGEAVAKEIGLDEVHAELLPGDKVDMVEKLLAECKGKEKLVFVGDGINDAPVLALSHVASPWADLAAMPPSKPPM